MDASILTSVKSTLGIPEDYLPFDQMILIHINSVFSTLTGLGVGPEDGFEIEDESSEWSEFFGDDKQNNQAISYMFLRVKLLFDPPQMSTLIDAMKEQIKEMEWRLNVHSEETNWVPDEVPLVGIIDGGDASP